ncbi:MAG: type II secretion system F family protein [Candidatus Aenigmatarchaeota archaeon]
MVERTALESYSNVDIERELELYKEVYFGKFLKIYEFLCTKIYNFLKLSTNDKNKIQKFELIKKDLSLKIIYNQVYSFQVFFLILMLFVSLLIFFIIFDMLILIILIVFSILLSYLIGEYPFILYRSTRNKKRAQLISFLLFLALKMRENPNLEKALLFTIRYLSPPIKIDILNLIRDIINKVYFSAAEALDKYSKSWEDEAPFFSIGMQFLISSIYEPNQMEREKLVDKALEESLDSLLSYMEVNVRELKGVIDIISVFGITFPTLLLTIFPLASVFLSEIFSPFILFVLVDVIIPIFVFVSIKIFIENRFFNIFSKGTFYYYLSLKEKEKELINLKALVASIGIVIITLYLIFQFLFNFLANYSLFNIILAGIFVFSIGLGIAAYHFIYYLAFRDLDIDLSKIEKDISSFSFTLGNVLMSNIPIEEAIIRIKDRFKGKPIENFLKDIHKNLKLGIPFKTAVFDRRIGALRKYPSAYLEAVMELLIESSSVSPQNCGKTAIFIAKYFKYIEKVKRRLLDLTAESISQIKVISRFVGPAILAVVIAVSILSLYILHSLGVIMKNIKLQMENPYSFNEYVNYAIIDVFSLFNVSGFLTPQKLYIIVGIFNIIITYLSVFILSIVEHEDDKIKKYKIMYDYMFKSSLLFLIFSLLSTIILWNLVSPLFIEFSYLF